MVKIFVGNLPPEATEEELKALFEEYGKVTECAIVKNFAFVHMEDRKEATKAIRNLHLHKLHNTPINVEASHGKNQGPVKLHVAGVESGCNEELRALFEEYGSVLECAVVKDFAFIHMPNYDEAMDAIEGLDNSEFQGKRIHVQLSKNRSKYDDSEDYYYPPPPPPMAERGGYWAPRYHGDRPEPPPPSYMRGRYMPPGYPAPPPPPPPPRQSAYPERPYDERERYGVVDYYEKYRARPYGTSYEEQRAAGPPPPPPPPTGVARYRVMNSSHDPYERRALPPPPPPPPSSYYGRDRSPLRRPPGAPAPPASNGYAYDRSAYGAPRPRDPYSERLPPPPPPPPRYAY